MKCIICQDVIKRTGKKVSKITEMLDISFKAGEK
jgi:hypothetical protein